MTYQRIFLYGTGVFHIEKADWNQVSGEICDASARLFEKLERGQWPIEIPFALEMGIEDGLPHIAVKPAPTMAPRIRPSRRRSAAPCASIGAGPRHLAGAACRGRRSTGRTGPAAIDGPGGSCCLSGCRDGVFTAGRRRRSGDSRLLITDLHERDAELLVEIIEHTASKIAAPPSNCGQTCWKPSSCPSAATNWACWSQPSWPSGSTRVSRASLVDDLQVFVGADVVVAGNDRAVAGFDHRRLAAQDRTFAGADHRIAGHDRDLPGQHLRG